MLGGGGARVGAGRGSGMGSAELQMLMGAGGGGSLLPIKCRRRGVLKPEGGPWRSSPIPSRVFSPLSVSPGWQVYLLPQASRSQSPILSLRWEGAHKKNSTGEIASAFRWTVSKKWQNSDPSQGAFPFSFHEHTHTHARTHTRACAHTHTTTTSHGLRRQRFAISAQGPVFLSEPSVADSAINLAVFPCHMA